MSPQSFINYIKSLLLACALLESTGFSQKYTIDNYNENTAVSNAFIYSLTKDSLGYMWIGTAEGLIRFNGKLFQKFTTADSVSDDFISCLIPDGNFMWIGHMNGSLTLYDNKIFKKIPLNIEDPGPVTCFDKDPLGSVWMGTYKGKLIKLNRKHGKNLVKSLTDDESVHSFIFVNTENILAGTSAGLCLWKITHSDKLQKVETIIENEQIISVISNYAGTGYFAASAGNRIYTLDHKFQVVDTIDHVTGIQSISADHYNTLWIATFGDGLINYNPDTYKLTSFRESTGENVKAVFIGNDGNIWVGGYGTGITKISNQIFTSLDYSRSDYGYKIKAVCHKGKNAWIATEKGILKTDLDGTISYFKSLPGNKITTLCCDQSGNTWIGTESEGIYIIDRKTSLKKFDIGEGYLEQSVTSMAVSDHYIWAGTKKGLCRVSLTDHKVKWYTISDGLPHNSINGLFKDDEGRIWISAKSNILAYLKDDKIERLVIHSPNAAISYNKFEVDESGLIWVSTLGNGLYRLGGDSVLNLTSQNGLYSDFCHSLINDRRNHLWVVHKDGLSRINLSTNFIRTYNEFNTPEDKFSFMPHASSIDDEGRIWIGTDNGIIFIDQSRESLGIPPVPDILSILINNEVYNANQPRIVLKPGKYTIQIEYGAISQKEPDMISYTIFMDGYDTQPEITRQGKVEYRNLTEGLFTFTVSALNGDGVLSSYPDRIEIYIGTPLFKQWWFYLIMLIIAFGLVIGYIKRREFIFNQERKRLEEKVIERTREIQEQKDEIEKQRDLIRLKNAEITSSIRYALEIQNALLPPESKMERYFPEHFIFMRPKDIVSGDFYWLARKNERIIFTVADCTGHGVPGGFMSMLGISILNEIVNVEGITDSDKIVSRLHTVVHKSLNRSRADGLDMALCSYDWTNRLIQFTGAMNHLVYFRDGIQTILKADQYSVNMSTDVAVTFSMQELKLQKGDMIYLYTDGFMDQFGGEKDKKYSLKRFYKLLHDIHDLPVKDQETFLDKRLSEWKKDCVQTDDITIMGIRF